LATQLSTPLPTQAGFLAWVRGVMGVPTEYLPDDSLSIGYAYNVALATVNQAFLGVPGPIYLIMVYNLAGHLLVMWAPDVPDLVYKVVDGVSYGYFAWLRKSNNMLGFVTGIVTASSDEGSSVTLTSPKQFDNLTIGQLQLTTTVWGRTYLGYAQDYGTNWGIT
jgi:hypothetical protein